MARHTYIAIVDDDPSVCRSLGRLLRLADFQPIDYASAEAFLADEKIRTSQIRRMPLGRIMTVEDIMGAIVFLASPASAMVTGTSLVIDGGFLTQ